MDNVASGAWKEVKREEETKRDRERRRDAREEEESASCYIVTYNNRHVLNDVF